MPRFLAIVAVLITVAVQPVVAVVTSDQAGSHVVEFGETTFGIDTSGVVIIGGMVNSTTPVGFCSGALISDRHVLSAAHCFDPNGEGVVDPFLSFFPHEAVFETAGGYVAIEYELESTQWPNIWPVSRADLAVIALTEDAPADVPRYPLYAGDQETGKGFVMVGYGAPGHGSTGESDQGDDVPTMRVGRNRYDVVRDDHPGVDFLAYDFDNGLEENNALAFIGFESDLGFGGDEALSATADSGGPTFLNGAIVGVMAFGDAIPAVDVNDDLDSSWGESGFDTRVSMFREFLHDATGGAALFVTDGDYDKGGAVDGNDFLIWQRQSGLTEFPAADGNGDGLANAADLTIWQDNFGTALPTPTVVHSAFNVPEPSAVTLLILVMLMGAFRRRGPPGGRVGWLELLPRSCARYPDSDRCAAAS